MPEGMTVAVVGAVVGGTVVGGVVIGDAADGAVEEVVDARTMVVVGIVRD